jgi:lysozyme
MHPANVALQPSPWLIDFIKQYERYRPTAYPATAAERAKGIWTCGWGHTAGVNERTTCDTATAEGWIRADLRDAVIAVKNIVTVALTQAQFDALVSLVFNCGPEPLHKTLGQKLNAGDYAGAAAEFKRWDRQGGKELDGLEKRRVAEANHFTGARPIALAA